MPRLAFAIAVALAASTAGLFGLPAPTDAWSANAFGPVSERQIFALTNQARAAAGRKALAWDTDLLSIARWRSRDMATRGFFSHEIPPSGAMVFDVMSEQGYCFNLAGENIGWNNYADSEATAHIQQSWMKSASHHENIVGKAWDAMAVGAYKLADGRHYWTVLFADRCPTAPPATPRPTARATGRPTPPPSSPVAPSQFPPTIAPTPASPTIAPSLASAAPASPSPALTPAIPSPWSTPGAAAASPSAGPVATPTPGAAAANPSPSDGAPAASAAASPAQGSPAPGTGTGPASTPTALVADIGGTAATSSPADTLRALATYARSNDEGDGVPSSGDLELPAGVALPEGTSLRVAEAPPAPTPGDGIVSGILAFLFGG